MPAAQAAEAVAMAKAVAVGAVGVMDGAAHQKAIDHLTDEVFKVR